MGLQLLFDVLFIVSFYFVNSFLATLSSLWFASPADSWLVRFAALLFLVVIIAAMLGIYSFFKYCVMDVLVGYTHKQDFHFSALRGFFLHNAVLVGIFFLISAVVNLLYGPLAPGGSPSLMVALPFSMLLAILLLGFVWYTHISQTIYYSAGRWSWQNFGKAWGQLRALLAPLGLLMVADVAVIGAFVGVFALLGLPFKEFFFVTPERIAAYYPHYTAAFTLLAVIVLYLLLLFNRMHISICALSLEEKD